MSIIRHTKKRFFLTIFFFSLLTYASYPAARECCTECELNETIECTKGSDNKDTENAKGNSDTKSAKDNKDSEDTKDSKNNSDTEDATKDNKESNNNKDTKNNKNTNNTKNSKDNNKGKNNGKDNKDNNKEKKDKKSPPKIGNFALPGSREPGPLISFGENIINKHEMQFFLFSSYTNGVRKYTIDAIPSLLYGITDSFSAFFNVPVLIRGRDNEHHSSGLEDMFLQLEYAFYSHETSCFSDQGTVVGYVAFPTGSAKKDPPTGLGSTSYFVGATFNRTYVDWLAFVSDGAILTTPHGNEKPGNTYLYQAGIGRNICSIPSKFIFNWLIEVDGYFTEKTKINGMSEPNTGGNVIYITPSLWFSTKKLILQLGVGFPVVQNLFGQQNPSNYLIALDFGWTF